MNPPLLTSCYLHGIADTRGIAKGMTAKSPPLSQPARAKRARADNHLENQFLVLVPLCYISEEKGTIILKKIIVIHKI